MLNKAFKAVTDMQNVVAFPNITVTCLVFVVGYHYKVASDVIQD